MGLLGLVAPLAVLTYYTYIERWTLAFTIFSVTKG
jgi:SNF family Na+-dependent transporter